MNYDTSVADDVNRVTLIYLVYCWL